MKNSLFILAIVCTMTGCASSSYVAAPNKDHPVQIFFGTEKPNSDYQVLGHINTSGAIFSTDRQLLRNMSKRVQRIGGNAVVDVRFSYIPWVLGGLPYVTGTVVKL